MQLKYEAGRQCPACTEKGISEQTFSRYDAWIRQWRENHVKLLTWYVCPECEEYKSKRPHDVRTHILHIHACGDLAHEVVRKHERTTYTREQAPNKTYIHPGKYSVQLAKVVQKRRAPLTPLTTNAKVPRLCRCEELEKRIQLLEEELRKTRVALNTPSNVPTERSELTDFLTKADQRVASWMKASREANKRLLDHERQQRRKAVSWLV